MIGREQYKDLSYYYDMLMNDVDYDAWSSYIIDIIRRYDIKGKKVLEMACGTGSMAVNMAKMGYSVTGFDLSSDMLSAARMKAIDNNVNIRLFCQDMRDIRLDEQFNIVLCLCDSINYITDKDDLFSVFKWVYNHIDYDGIFIFDINSAYKLKKVIGNNTFTHNEEDIAYIWDNYITEEDTVEFYLSFFVKQGELYRRFDEIHVEKIYEAEEIIELLRIAGFSHINFYEGFTFEDIKDTTERINFVVKK